MNKLVLLCGKPGCGKTTIAQQLHKDLGYIHFSADDYMLRLFGEITQREIFEQKLQATKDLIYSICDQILPNNNVVLDFGFWTKQERQSLLQRFANSQVVLVYIKLDNDEIFRRVQHRNKNLKPSEYYMDKSTFDILAGKFEEPNNNDENFIKFVNQEQLYIDLK